MRLVDTSSLQEEACQEGRNYTCAPKVMVENIGEIFGLIGYQKVIFGTLKTHFPFYMEY